jgi:uncharacterized protein YqjF (DUF2071 family)
MSVEPAHVIDPELVDSPVAETRPAGRAAGYHTWTDLLFLHWRVPIDLLRPLVPAGLQIETFDGDAWLGVVPFHIRGLRPWWFPAVPGLSEFHETNLRTYVRFEGRDPGVWFFSLDAACLPAVEIARRKWHLSYFYAAMELVRRDERVLYRSHRRDRRFDQRAEVEIDAAIGGSLLNPDDTSAAAGTLEHFLAERYVLYAADPNDRLYLGRVWHRPYQLRSAKLLHCRQTLSDAVDVELPETPHHAMFCDRVSVEVFPITRIT